MLNTTQLSFDEDDMVLWFRLIGYLLSAWQRPGLEAPFGLSGLDFRVLPSDLDISGHMNNGRYLMLMDLGRLDLMVQLRLWRAILKQRWTPVATTATIRFRRELRLLERFRLESQIVSWDSTSVIIEHRFRLLRGSRQGSIAAIGFVKAGLYDRRAKAFVPIEQLFGLAGATPAAPPQLTPAQQAFLDQEASLRTIGRERSRDGAPEV